MKKALSAAAVILGLATPALADERYVYVLTIDGFDMEPQVAVLRNKNMCDFYSITMIKGITEHENARNLIPYIEAGCYPIRAVPKTLLINAEYIGD